ncbi:MAG: DUF3786 domain-containing protein, partial [Candidatus Electrothrix sp. AR3]|nr:DUF3786 domain-containing protein [Candidatus Electrothrix sp. AR3]
MTPHEFLKYLPVYNCEKCGYPACLAFAAAVTRGGVSPELCPYLNRKDLPVDFFAVDKNVGANILDQGQKERDLALVAHLKSKIEGLDLSSSSQLLGARWTENTLEFSYLRQAVELGAAGILLAGKEPADPRDQILLYNYVAFGQIGAGRIPDNDWIGMESLPNSISKIRTLATYCELRLADRFSGRASTLHKLSSVIGAKNGSLEQSADVGVIIPVLPRIPLYLLFWDEEPEEGFEAKIKILILASNPS